MVGFSSWLSTRLLRSTASHNNNESGCQGVLTTQNNAKDTETNRRLAVDATLLVVECTVDYLLLSPVLAPIPDLDPTPERPSGSHFAFHQLPTASTSAI